MSIQLQTSSIVVAAAILIACQVTIAADEKEVSADRTEPSTTVTDQTAGPYVDLAEPAPEPLGFGELPENFGWLSDPSEEPKDLADAIFGGKFNLDLRLRLEQVHQDGFRNSTAMTGRIRFGYRTKPWHGFSAFGEMEAVGTPDSSLYSVPPAGQGDPTRAVVADPHGIELNQGYGRYQYDDLGLDIKAGRQVINLDNQRFIGAVGWRQFEQTFDAVSIKSSLGVENLELFYAFIWHVQRIFGPDGPNFDSHSHLIHGAYEFMPELKVTPFAYLLDFSDSAVNSTNTFGVRVTGTFDLEEYLELAGANVGYAFTYAYQTDAANNPTAYQANFVSTDWKLSGKGIGYVGVGYQLLGSDGGTAAFIFPLGTNHAFNGWADVFLVTPAAGLQDLYVYTGTQLPGEINGKLVFHKYWSDVGSADFGWEIDALLSKKISRNWSVLAKYAYYEGDGAFADRNKLWIQTTFSF